MRLLCKNHLGTSQPVTHIPVCGPGYKVWNNLDAQAGICPERDSSVPDLRKEGVGDTMGRGLRIETLRSLTPGSIQERHKHQSLAHSPFNRLSTTPQARVPGRKV